jgi:hypothetical protein
MLVTGMLYRHVAWLSCCLLAVAACGGGDTTPSTTARRGSAAAGAVGPGGVANPTSIGAPGSFGNPTGLAPLSAQAGSGGNSDCRTVTVAFVIDGSGSMCEPFGSSTRWTSLRTALLDKTKGLFYRVTQQAALGLYLYDGTIDFQLSSQAASGPAATCTSPSTRNRLMGGMCPQIVEVKPAVGNAAALDKKYPATELGGSTPTDKAMSYVVGDLMKLRGTSTDPQYIILATDGQPNDICTGGTGGDGTAQQQGVITAVDMAAAAGITTFVISLASDPALQMHLDEVARHGNKADATAHTFSPTTPEDLVQTLTGLLGNAIGCPI